MALIDLSRINIEITNPTQGKQVFSSEGAGAYRALAGLGANVAGIAGDMYAKHMDIFTDREQLAATENFKLDLAKKQAWALTNTDTNTDLVSGTDQTYEEYISSYIDESKLAYEDSLTESMSKTKYQFSMAPLITKEKADSVFKSSAITTKNTLIRSNQFYSNTSNAIMNSDSLGVLENLNVSLESAKPHINSIAKTSGLTVAQEVEKIGNKQLLESSLEAALRNMGTDPAGVLDFNLILGPGLVFKDLGEYRKYVMETYSDWGGTGDQAEDAVAIEQYMIANSQNALLAEGHPLSKLLSPDEKKEYLKRALAIMFKNKKKKDSDLAEQKADWIKYPSTKLPESGRLADLNNPKVRSAIALRGSEIYVDSDPIDQIRAVYKMVDERIKYEAEENQITKGRYAYTKNPNEIAQKRSEWANDILEKMMPDQDLASIRKNAFELGSSSLNSLQDTLRKQQRDVNETLNINPLKYKYQDPGFSSRLNKAMTVTPTGIKVNKKAMENLAAELDTYYKGVGTLAASISKGDILADRQLSPLLDKLETMDSGAKLNFYKELNELDPKVSEAFYTQAIREKKMDIGDQFILGNSQIGDASTSDFYTKKFLDIENKYTQPYMDKLIKEFKTSVNWWTADKDFADLEESVVKAAADSDYLQSLKETARASGRSEEAIKAMFSERFLSKVTLDYMTRNSPNKGIGGFWSFNSMVKDSFNKVLEDTYSKRITPVNTSAIKANVLPGEIKDIEASNTRAEEVSTKIIDAIKSGDLKISQENYTNTAQSKKYSKLSSKLQGEYFVRDVMSGTIFKDNLVLAQDFGKQKEMYLRFKDKGTGSYYNLRLTGPDGKTKVLFLNNIKDLETKTSDEIFSELTKGLQHPKTKSK